MDPNFLSHVGFRMPAARVRLALHLPLLGLIGVNVLLGQVLMLTHLPEVLPRELFVLFLSAVAHATALFLAISLLLGFVTSAAPGRVGAAIWGLATTVSMVFWLDSFGYRWLDLHIDDTLSLLFWNLRGDFLVMRSKLLLFGLGLLLVVAVLAAATVFHRATSRRFWWGHYPASPRAVGLGFLAALLLLVPTHLLMKHQVSDTVQFWFHQAEWPLDLVAPTKSALLTIDDPQFLPPPDAAVIEAKLRELRSTHLARRPNIFLFVVESLRGDAVSAEGAPNLFQLRNDSLPIMDGQANGNCTHIAWFSLLNSSSPMLWSLLAKSPERTGAVPLRALRALGYRISVLSTPSLHYFDTDHTLFSRDLSLADEIVDQATLMTGTPDAQPADLDRVVMDRLIGSLDAVKPDGGRFFSVFLDAPHHDYTWPRGFPAQYEPYLETINLFQTKYDESEIHLLKNRYRNSVYFTDSLLGEFFRALKDRGLWDDSIIIVVGDHGEEFMERGHLTHSSELNRFQTSITFMFRLPRGLQASVAPTSIRVASQVDVFPTLFDLLGVGAVMESLLWGTSLVGPRPPRFAISARCTSFAPKQVVILDGTEKILIEFDGIASTNFAHGLHARRLRVVDVLDDKDESIVVRGHVGERLSGQARSILGDALRKMLTTPVERTDLPIPLPDRRSAFRLGTHSPCCRP